VKQKLRSKLKEILSKIIPDNTRMQFLVLLPKFETWRKSHSEEYPTFFARQELYSYINNTLLENKDIEYLEFGVYKGETITNWTEINSSANSRFFGFDTFVGLPQPWGRKKVGSFSVEGKLPNFKDARVVLVEGLFQDTLPPFLESFRPQKQLVIHNDSDTYSATLYVLTKCDVLLTPGTIIIFDEFSSILHEFRALEDYCSSYLKNYKVITATKSPTNYFVRVAIQIIKNPPKTK